jgi:hypothetical protein
MYIKFCGLALALSSMALFSGLAWAETTQVQTIQIVRENTLSNYFSRHDSFTRLCVNGTCRSFNNCPALPVLLRSDRFRMAVPTLQSATVFCRSKGSAPKSPAIILPQFKGGETKTHIYQSHTQSSQGGVTRVYSHQSTLIPR